MYSTRTHHFLDIENLCGTNDLDTELVTSTFLDYLNVTCAAESDLVTVTSSHHNYKTVAFALKAIRSLHLPQPRSGPDGADLVLVDEIDATRMRKGFDRICIGSGDHIFAFPLARLSNLGFHTTSVSRRDSCSMHVTRTADTILYLPDHAPTHTTLTQEIA